MRETSECRTAHSVYVADDQKLRRAGLAQVLSEWAAEHGYSVREMPFSAPDSEFEPAPAMIILVTGHESLADPAIYHKVSALAGLNETVPVIVISDHETPEESRLVFRSGARALITTNSPAGVAVAALEFIRNGGTYFPPSSYDAPKNGHAVIAAAPVAATHVNGGPETDGAGSGPQLVARLTQRQDEVLQFVQSGSSNKEIARELKLSEATVKLHVRQLMKKLGASNRTQVAMLGHSLQNGERRRSMNGGAEPVQTPPR